LNQKGQKITQKKLSSISLCFKGKKSKNYGRQAANKKMAGVSPLQGC
jgi:hypothetical protein